MSDLIAILHEPLYTAELIECNNGEYRQVRVARGNCPDEALRKLEIDDTVTLVSLQVGVNELRNGELIKLINMALNHAEKNR